MPNYWLIRTTDHFDGLLWYPRVFLLTAETEEEAVSAWRKKFDSSSSYGRVDRVGNELKNPISLNVVKVDIEDGEIVNVLSYASSIDEA